MPYKSTFFYISTLEIRLLTYLLTYVSLLNCCKVRQLVYKDNKKVALVYRPIALNGNPSDHYTFSCTVLTTV